ncbi:MAG: type II toxin-antitoxin system RelE/ParE family toxin [Thermomicrobiales bacterium]
MKELQWVNDGVRREIASYEKPVKQEIGYALYAAQRGMMAECAKPLKGFGGASVIEITVDEDGDTFRTVYTVQLADAIWVLHSFQKKSTKGIATPKHEIDLIKQRLRRARELSAELGRGNQ